MKNSIPEEMIAVIRREQERRLSEIADEDQNYAFDQWLFRDAPFLNELCLMLLVAIRHQLERDLVRLAARVGKAGTLISHQQYKENIQRTREELRDRKGWKKLGTMLRLESCEGYESIEILRLLTNSYKHHPLMEPDKDLVKKLCIDSIVNFAPLPESDLVRESVADLIGLSKGASYCDIAERFMDIATRFLTSVQIQTALSEIELARVSLNPKDFAQ